MTDLLVSLNTALEGGSAIERFFRSGYIVLFLILALPCLGARPTPAAGQTLKGVVLERGTDRPIVLAKTVLLGPGDSVVAQTLSDASGAFSLSSREAGEFLLQTTALGYRESRAGIFELGPGGEMTLQIRLVPEPLEIEGLTVYAEAAVPKLVESGFLERFQGGIGHFLTPADLESGTGRLLIDRLARVPGVRVVRDRVYLFNRARPCVPPVYLDGVIVSWVNGDVEALVGLEDVEGVEVYQGTTRHRFASAACSRRYAAPSSSGPGGGGEAAGSLRERGRAPTIGSAACAPLRATPQRISAVAARLERRGRSGFPDRPCRRARTLTQGFR